MTLPSAKLSYTPRPQRRHHGKVALRPSIRRGLPSIRVGRNLRGLKRWWIVLLLRISLTSFRCTGRSGKLRNKLDKSSSTAIPSSHRVLLRIMLHFPSTPQCQSRASNSPSHSPLPVSTVFSLSLSYIAIYSASPESQCPETKPQKLDNKLQSRSANLETHQCWHSLH